MLTLISIIVFYVLLSILLKFLTRTHQNSLNRNQIFLTFGFKIVFGCLYGYLFHHFYNGDDTWAIHLDSLKEWELLRNNPLQFFREYTPETAIRNAEASGNFLLLYLADLEYCLLTKTLGIFNGITQGNYYVNVVLYNFIVFWGHYWLFRMLVKEYPEKKLLFLIVIFFLPTALFWLSGIRSDGLLFFFFSLLLFSFHRYLKAGRFVDLLLFIIGLCGVVIFRSAVAIILLPGLVSWYIVRKKNKVPSLAFISIYGIFLLLFFASSLFPFFNGPAAVSIKQSEFFQLHGNTRYSLNKLEPTFQSFIQTLPQAFANTFFRPFFWEAKGILQLLAAMGIFLFWGVAILSLIRRKKQVNQHHHHQSIFFILLLFGCSYYLLIGLTVPFPGAIVRYKSIAEICLFISMILTINPDKFVLKKNNTFLKGVFAGDFLPFHGNTGLFITNLPELPTLRE